MSNVITHEENFVLRLIQGPGKFDEEDCDHEYNAKHKL